MFKAPSGVAFEVFGYDVRYYGLIMFFAIISGVLTTYFVSKKYYKNLDLDALLDFLPWLIIISMLSARLYYVLLSLDFYITHPAEILAVWHGGISIHGAILGGLIFGIIYFKIIKKTFFLRYADAVSYGLVIGQGIGRWGNFFNSEAFGRPCDLPWKLYIDPIYRPAEMASYSYFHPTFLYESILDFLIFLTLFFMVRKIVEKCASKTAGNLDGVVFFSYLALYSLVRIFVENIRVDSVLNVSNVPIATIVSLFGLFVSILALIFIVFRQKKPANH